MTGTDIRQQFLDFFKSKGHHIVPSASIVVKNDPTLLFTNAGMNQFKEYFLGNKKAEYPRIADTQKCLRVSGKHNDLEEVGVDTYHHTMFEMLGNWSFGDYFKKEAIAWSWELLTEVYKLDKNKLYVTVFEGDEKEGLPRDDEAFDEWKKWISEDRILFGKKKDNFWEMGDTGPCGPCTEIHVDCRSDEEKKLVDGKTLVNNDHAQVIEIWNNVFIQYNRLKGGMLESLPAKHVDTGMGFERLVCVLQNKTSNYDTDVFTGTIEEIKRITGRSYNKSDNKQDVAFRVLADHIRAISFTIADGQLPSNTGAGYVIRRILRRAVRYYYSYLDYKQPLLYQLIPLIAKQFENVFPELNKQKDFVEKVVKEEEESFLRTLGKGIEMVAEYFDNWMKMRFYILKIMNHDEIDNAHFNEYQRVLKFISEHNTFKLIGLYKLQEYSDNLLKQNLEHHLFDSYNNPFKNQNEFINEVTYIQNHGKIIIDGKFAFELYDTFGFPIDLTNLMASEFGWTVDMKGFEQELQQQKKRSRAATAIDSEDWVTLIDSPYSEFIGYDSLEAKTKILKYRKVKSKGKEAYQLVLQATPFYAESGGQVGDTGTLNFDGEIINIIDTKKENNLFIHFTEKLPENILVKVDAKVDREKRKQTEIHHSATHLLHAALRQVLGKHVAQKGSLVNDQHLRFDFSHFAKVTDEEIARVEKIVNQKIRQNIPVIIKELPKEEALKLGAMALFGEKYGDIVRVVIIDPIYSVELCGGTHVGATGELGFFKIAHESAVAAGVRRVEAVAGIAAEEHIHKNFLELKSAKEKLNNTQDLNKSIEDLLNEETNQKRKIESSRSLFVNILLPQLSNKAQTINSFSFIGEVVNVPEVEILKQLRVELSKLINGIVILCGNFGNRVEVSIAISEGLVSKGLSAKKIIKEQVGALIKGGGDGSEFLASAGGKDASKFPEVIEKVRSLL